MKRIISILMALISVISVYAFSEEVIDGVVYRIQYEHAEVMSLSEGSNPDFVIIPESINYNGVTLPVECILDKAFYCNYWLTGIELPSTIKHIGNDAFYGCISLKGITLPDSLELIQNNAFADSGIENIAFKSTVCPEFFDIASSFAGLTLKNISFPKTSEESYKEIFSPWIEDMSRIDFNIEEEYDKVFFSGEVLFIPEHAEIASSYAQHCAMADNSSVLFTKTGETINLFTPFLVGRGYDIKINEITPDNGYLFLEYFGYPNHCNMEIESERFLDNNFFDMATGIYQYPVEADFTYSVANISGAGIENAGENDRLFDVFTLDGVKKASGLKESDIRKLGKGLYILNDEIGSKKVIVH